MSRPSASLSTIKGLSLTFSDFAAFKHALSSPGPSERPRGQAAESQPRRGHRHSASTSSMASTSSARSWSPTTPTWTPSSPTSSYMSRPRRLTEREKADLANYTQPEMDITEMVSMFKDDVSFEPLQ